MYSDDDNNDEIDIDDNDHFSSEFSWKNTETGLYCILYDDEDEDEDDDGDDNVNSTDNVYKYWW